MESTVCPYLLSCAAGEEHCIVKRLLGWSAYYESMIFTYCDPSMHVPFQNVHLVYLPADVPCSRLREVFMALLF